MTIQIVSMKYTGQQVIADVGEVYQSEEAKEEGARPLCLTFTDPYLLEIEDETSSGFNLRMSKWNPYTDEKAFNIGFDLIGLINDPKRAILDAYKLRIQSDAPKQEQTLAAFDGMLQPNVPSTTSILPELSNEEMEFTEETVVDLGETNEEVIETV